MPHEEIRVALDLSKAVALIEQQQQEIAALKAEAQELHDKYGKLWDEKAVLKAEIAELKAGHFRVEGELHPTPCTWGILCPYCRINELTAERDGYLSGQQQMQDTCSSLQDNIAKYAEGRKVLKAEAQKYRTVMEKIKEEHDTYQRANWDYIIPLIEEALRGEEEKS